MRYGSRQIMDVVFKDYKTGEPKVYFESLTTSSIEFASATVAARGGKGHPKIIVWDSEKDVTMNMEDALITKESLGVLIGSQFNKGSKVAHKKDVVTIDENMKVVLSQIPLTTQKYFLYKTEDGVTMGEKVEYVFSATPVTETIDFTSFADVTAGDKLIVDYYYLTPGTTQSITVTSDVFPGVYRVEGVTDWRNEDGEDVEALYTIPKLKVNSNFTINHASSGDPTPFTFTCDVLKDRFSNEMVTIDLLEA